MKRVLVVDDDYDICEAVQLLLESRYDVALAYDGAQALQLLREEHFDAVLLDLMMPVMDGETLMAVLSDEGLDVPVIFASAGQQLSTRARRAGAAGWLEKPFDASSLDDVLGRVLGRAERDSGLAQTADSAQR